VTSKEINLTPPLEMGRTTCLWIGASGHSNELGLKSLSKTPIMMDSKTTN